VTRPWVSAFALVSAVALAGCAAPYDDDGEVAMVPVAQRCGSICAPGAPIPPATPVVVDTDLGGDDLVALAFLLRHPEVRVEAVTIAATGLVGCDPGVDLVADLFTALDEEPVPVACGRAEPGPGALELPQEWRDLAATGTGIPRSAGTLTADAEPAPDLIGRLARRVDGLQVVELGPMTNLADLATGAPRAYARLAGIHAMGGSVDGPLVDGVAEWNVAADPEAFATVLAADVPLTVVPEDAIPEGTPEALSAPVVRDVPARIDYPKWWDLAAAATLVAGRGVQVESGTWAIDRAEPGRLRREGEGPVRVVRSLDEASLEAEYARAFEQG
jgi:Inosine-uridine preferring nucleoside hydrolase